MTVHTVPPNILEAIAFETGEVIHVGAHEADVRVGDDLFVARLSAVTP